MLECLLLGLHATFKRSSPYLSRVRTMDAMALFNFRGERVLLQLLETKQRYRHLQLGLSVGGWGFRDTSAPALDSTRLASPRLLQADPVPMIQMRQNYKRRFKCASFE